MPENNKKPSPLKAIPPQLIMPMIKGGLGAFSSGISNIRSEFGQIKDKFKEEGYKDAKLGKKLKMLGGAAGRLWMTGNQAALSGILGGALGNDFGLGNIGFLKDNQPVAQPVEQQPTYRSNINPITEEEMLPNQDLVNKGIPMVGKPIKALTQMQGTVAHNMSAKQYNKALQMKEISGASTIPSPMAKMSDRDYDGDGKVESSKEEYFGSRDKAIKENKN